MKIAIDGRVLERAITGVGRYLINILHELPKYSQGHEIFIFTNKQQNHVNDSHYNYITSSLPFINAKIFIPFWLNVVLPSLIKKYNMDLLIGPNILVPWTNKISAKRISIVHDIMPLTHPQFFPKDYIYFLKYFLPKSLRSSDKIITISEASKMSIQSFFNIPAEKIEVVYNTSAKSFTCLSSEELQKLKREIQLDLPEKFLLYVGVLEKRKNIPLLIKLSDRLKDEGIDIKIVLAGKSGFGFEEFKDNLEVRKDRMIWLTQVNERTLVYLYNSAFCLIFPSYVEGFGLPPLEAMSCGLPVITSNCDALVEVVQNAGLLCNPDDVDCYFNGVLKLITDEKFYNEMRVKSLKRSQFYSGDLAIRNFLKVIDSLN